MTIPSAVLRHLTSLLLGAAVALAAVTPSVAADQWRYEGVERVVAIGDVHGAYDELAALLRQAGVVNQDLRWSGGAMHLVSMGDLVDRGARSRDVLDLMMRLEGEAAEAGGQVHVLLGNHEAMQLTGERRYTSDAEYAAFADEEDPARREAAYAAYLERRSIADDASARSAFAEKYPPGYFGHQAAFSPDGRYGSWILERPVVLVVNETLYVHGGLTDSLADMNPAELNARSRSDLEQYARAWATLRGAGIVDKDTEFQDRASAAAAAAAIDPALADAAGRLAAAESSPIFLADGPLWYRGTAWCNENAEVVRVDRVLNHMQASRVALGHTPTPDSLIIERMDGRVLMLDTGMLTEVYEGRGSALIESSRRLAAAYAGSAGTATIEPAPRRVGSRSGGLTDDQLEDILANGEIVSIEDVGEGVTKPQKVIVRKDGHEVKAIFKTESTPLQGGSRRQQQKMINLSDRWEHEVAAYRLDRLIGLDLVPVTVRRTIGGREGSLSFWIDGLINQLQKEEQDVPATGWCSLAEQWPLMFVFDTLVYNEDRTKQNMVYGRDDWMMYLIDHSRSFRTHRGRPKDIRNVQLKLSPMLAQSLENLDYEQLNEAMAGLLVKSQVQAITRRRDEILKDWKKGQ
jgi:hypothetical protein